MSSANNFSVKRFSEISALCVAVVSTLVEALLYKLYKPSTFDAKNFEGIVIPSNLSICKPEPYELLIYAVILITFSAVFFFLKELLTFLLSRKEPKSLEKLLFFMQIFTFVVFVLAICMIIFEKFGKICLFIICLSVVFSLIIYINEKFSKKKTNRLDKYFFFLVSFVVIVFFAYVSSNINFSLTNNYYNDHHVYAVWYPIYKVASGQTIGVDFDCIYGFYAYIVVPIIKLFAEVNQSSFSVFIAIILSISAASYYIFSYKFINNKFIACICATIASFFGPYSFFSASVYFQYFPLRSIFVSCVLISICIFDKLKKHKTVFSVFMCFLLSAAIIWNFETGLVAAIIWSGFVIYRSVYYYGLTDKKTITVIIKSIVSVVFSVALFVIIIELITFLRSGKFIGTDKLLFGIKAFAGTGACMLPIKYDIWIILVIMVGAGLFYSLLKIGIKPCNKKNDISKISALFAISITAAGCFSYFMGRSYITNAFVIAPYCLLICGMLIDFFLADIIASDGIHNLYIKSADKICNKVKIILCCGFIVLMVFQTAYNFRKPGFYLYTLLASDANQLSEKHNSGIFFHSFISQKDDRESAVYLASDQIKTWSDEYNNGQIPHLMISYSSFVEEILGKPSTDSKCEIIDCFYYENVKTIMDFIKMHPNESYVIDENVMQNLQDCYPEELEDFKTQYRLVEQKEFSWNYYFYMPK